MGPNMVGRRQSTPMTTAGYACGLVTVLGGPHVASKVIDSHDRTADGKLRQSDAWVQYMGTVHGIDCRSV